MTVRVRARTQLWGYVCLCVCVSVCVCVCVCVSMQIYMPTFVGKCTTDASGTCTIPMPTASSSSEWLAYRGLVIAPNHAGVIYSELGSYGPEAPSTNYTGTLALDRALVRQGDTLHVTGYIGQRDAGGGGGGNGSAVSTWPVKAPDVTQATVLISPGWQGGNAVT